MLDGQQRNIDYMRISVTDKCNLRCVYCMPECGIESICHEEVLSFEELVRVASAAAQIGIRKLKITGGEPLVRHDIVTLIGMLHAVPGIEEITMTTNGILFAGMAKELKKAGLSAVNISLDTLNPTRFSAITRLGTLGQALDGLYASLEEGFRTKINCVPIREFNLDEITDLAELARTYPVDVRFIELMPIGYGKQYAPIPSDEIISILTQQYGPMMKDNRIHGNGPANYYQIAGFNGSIGLISAMTHEFCGACNRIRLTSDGMLKLCLHYNRGVDLRRELRNGIRDTALVSFMAAAISTKPAGHQFGEAVPDAEMRNMVQIGG